MPKYTDPVIGRTGPRMTPTPDRLLQIEKVYRSALERAPIERPQFLSDACADDEELRRQVESLLIHGETDSGLRDRPAQQRIGNFPTATITLATGAQFGAYRIEAPIGSGGMGIVYRALDTRLGRQVALKLLL